jgi:ADP-heptose:LPS heptosyltransferase
MPLKGSLADSFKLLAFQTVYYLAKCIPARSEPGRLLLVKTDEIGDYLLFRNFLKEFKATGPYTGHRVYLVGNKLCKSLYETYDEGAVDEVIWLDKVKFRRDLRYRFSVLRRIRQLGFSDVVNLVYSRDWRYDEVLVAVSTAGNRIAMQHIPIPVSALEEKLIPGRLYSELVDVGDQRVFDGEKNARFVGHLVKTPLEPTITLPVTGKPEMPLPDNYFVLFPGSGNPIRRWPAAYFAAVANHLIDKFRLEPVICGSPVDKADADAFVDLFGRPVINLVGKTTLPGFLSVLKGAKCLISVDTGAVHMAAAVGCPVFGLFSGLYYGRFAPYPRAIAPNFIAIYPAEIQEKIGKGQSWDVNVVPIDLLRKIPPETVIARLDEYFAHG